MVNIGLLGNCVCPRYFDQIGKNEVKAARAQLDVFDKALATYRLDAGHQFDVALGYAVLSIRSAQLGVRASFTSPTSARFDVSVFVEQLRDLLWRA